MSIELFVPGRLCLFGEHSDWAGFFRAINSEITPGAAVVTGIEHGIHAVASKDDNFIVNVQIEGHVSDSFSSSMNIGALREVASSGGFFSYVAGVASLMKENYRTGGVKIDITKSDLPLKKGLSSSAAVCVLVARAFNRLYNLRLSTLGEMEIAYRGEIRTPSRCGRLDQACAFGKRPVHITFDSGDISVSRLRVGAPFHFVFADLMAKKDTVRILADLNRCYPFPETELHKKVHEALGRDNAQIIERAAALLASGDARGLGELMVEAQKLFDEKVAPACVSELTSPVLHKVLADAKIKSLTFGGKGVGSQGDGTVQFVARDVASQSALVEYLDSIGMTAYSFTLSPQRTIRKAVIPVAGFGTRLYPISRAVKKEFFPIIDADGLAKPAILILLDELVAAGIEEICLVIGEGDREWYERMFAAPLCDEHFQKLSSNAKIYEKKLREIWEKLRFVRQTERLGFGHAVYQAREFAEGEPVLLLLGDQIYRSFDERSCTAQLLDAYERTGRMTVSVHSVPLDEVEHYGILSGEWDEPKFMNVSRIAEKPTRDYAEQHLKTGGECYAVFGQYILTSAVFEVLERNIREMRTSGGEVQLTNALDEVREREGMTAFVPNGESYDIGLPEAYRRTVGEF